MSEAYAAPSRSKYSMSSRHFLCLLRGCKRGVTATKLKKVITGVSEGWTYEDLLQRLSSLWLSEQKVAVVVQYCDSFESMHVVAEN